MFYKLLKSKQSNYKKTLNKFVQCYTSVCKQLLKRVLLRCILKHRQLLEVSLLYLLQRKHVKLIY